MSSFRVHDGQGAQAADINSIIAQLQGQGVISGGTVTSAAAGPFVVELESTAVFLNGTEHDVEEQTIDLEPYLDTDGGNPRKVILYINTDGGVVVAPGEPAMPRPQDQYRWDTYRPAPPDLSHIDAVPLAEVWLSPDDIQLSDADIRDRSLSADLEAYGVTAETGEFDEIVDGAGVSHTGELADMDIVKSVEDIREAIRTDTTHATSAPHDYFSGAHGDLTGIEADNHHPRYEDDEARDAIRGSLAATELTAGDAETGNHLEYSGEGLTWAAPPIQQADVLANGTVTHTGGSTTTVTLSDVAGDETAEFDLSVGVASDPEWTGAYGYTYEAARQWDDTNGTLNIELTIEWTTDPGTGNDLELAWTAWDGSPAVVEGRWSDANTVESIDGATIEPAIAAVSDRLNAPVVDNLSAAPAATLGDTVIASGDGDAMFGQYLYDGDQWTGPLGTSVSTLSELSIDTAKDWDGNAIPNVGAPEGPGYAARRQELTDHADASDAHHAKTQSSDIDHGEVGNIQPDQHHERPDRDAMLDAVSGRYQPVPLTASEIPGGEYLRAHLHLPSDETLSVVRGMYFASDGSTPSNLSLQLYNRSTASIVYQQQGAKLQRGSREDPLATVDGEADLEVRISNQRSESVNAGGSMTVSY